MRHTKQTFQNQDDFNQTQFHRENFPLVAIKSYRAQVNDHHHTHRRLVGNHGRATRSRQHDDR